MKAKRRRTTPARQPTQLELLGEGVDVWNEWRERHSDVKPALSYATLRGSQLRGVNLTYANLSYADLSDASLVGADLRFANLTETNLNGADLTSAKMVQFAVQNFIGMRRMGSDVRN